MSTTYRDMLESKTGGADARSNTNQTFTALKSKASNALSSPYVVGGAVLGVAAAGYALVNRKKIPLFKKAKAPERSINIGVKKTPAPKKVPERSINTVELLKAGGSLVALLASLSSTRKNDSIDSADMAHQEKERVASRISEDSKPPAEEAEPAAGTPAKPRFEQTSKSWFGKQWQICMAAANAWMDDYAPSMGAALSYYTLFSLAPLLVLIIAIAGLVFGQDAAQGAIIAQLQGIMGKDGAGAVQGLLNAAREPSTGIIASIVGGFLLLLGATAIFAELQTDLDRIWEVPAKEKPSGIWGWLRARVLSFGLVLGLAFMLMISLVVSAALAASSQWLSGGEVETMLATTLNFAASFAIFTVLFAMIYKIMPTAKISWHDVWMGAAVTALLFNVGKALIGLYLAKSSVASGFGAAGSFVILVAWFYYSAQIFLFGAEYTWVYSNSKVQGK